MAIRDVSAVPQVSFGRKRIAVGLGTTAGLLALVVVCAYSPAEVGFYPDCVWRMATGLYCPGCGGLRALHELLHGRIVAAVSYNALLTIIAPPASAWFGWALYCGRRLQVDRWSTRALALAALFAAARNVPIYPFTLLAP